MQRSNTYTIGFAAAICLVCGVIVAGFAVGLKERQEENAVLDRQKKVLIVAGLMRNGEQKTAQEIQDLFKKNIEPRIVVLKTGQYNDKGDVNAFDQQKLTKDPATSIAAPTNKAGVPKSAERSHGLHQARWQEGGPADLARRGQRPVVDFVRIHRAIERCEHREGFDFYKHGETPGLGGEIENPLWTGLWPGSEFSRWTRLASRPKWLRSRWSKAWQSLAVTMKSTACLVRPLRVVV